MFRILEAYPKLEIRHRGVLFVFIAGVMYNPKYWWGVVYLSGSNFKKTEKKNLVFALKWFPRNERLY